jgi:hypothetical protein
VPLGGRIVSTLLLAEGAEAPRAVYRSRIGPAGELLDPAGVPLADANLSQLLVLSWSSDGARILLEERLGARQSDAFEARLAVYEMASGKTRFVPLETLATAVRRHWATRGEPLEGREVQLDVLGWEGRSPHRLLVRPVVLWEPGAPFLGVWSVDLDGKAVRLVTERDRPGRPGLFGTPSTP